LLKIYTDLLKCSLTVICDLRNILERKKFESLILRECLYLIIYQNETIY
jgi:hypothetical protein